MSDYIVLLKQVPDICAVCDNAFDDNGLLKRGSLPLVVNSSDKSALAFARKMQSLEGDYNSRIIALTMGPKSASEVIVYALSRCADLGYLLSDSRFAGADTWATAYLLGEAIKRLRDQGVCRSDYKIVCGMQSCDGDTAQVPPQLAAYLDIPIVPYAVNVEINDKRFIFDAIDYEGDRKVGCFGKNAVITVASYDSLLYPSFARTRWAKSRKINTITADDIGFDTTALKISKTRVVKIFVPPKTKRKRIKLTGCGEAAYVIKQVVNTGVQSQDADALTELSQSNGLAGEVWVASYAFDGSISNATFELVSEASILAEQLNAKCAVVLVGNNCSSYVDKLTEYGAQKVYIAEDADFEVFDAAVYSRQICHMLEKGKPRMVIFEASAAGRVIAPMVAMKSGNGLTADCISLRIGKPVSNRTGGELIQTRPALGGNVMARILSVNSDIEMATVRSGVFKAQKFKKSSECEVVKVEKIAGEKSIDLISSDHASSKIDFNADIIISGGAGFENKSEFSSCMHRLAELLKPLGTLRVELGASRQAVELGYAQRERQIGQTGITVRPKLYIALGISGSVQHIVGISGSYVIISVNSDPTAPIFEHSDYYLTCQAQQFVEGLAKELES